MKHGGGGSSSRLQTSPQLSPGFPRRGQSPQARGASPMPGFTSPRVSSPRPGSARGASPLPPAQQNLNQQQGRKEPQQQAVTKTAAQQEQPSQQPQLSVSSGQTGSVRFQTSTSPSSPPSRGQAPSQQAYMGGVPFQNLGQGHDQGHMPQGHGQVPLPQGHGFQGQGMPAGYPGYPAPFPTVGSDRFQGQPPQARMGLRQEPPRMQQGFISPPAQPVTSPEGPNPGPRHLSPSTHPLNQEMLSALRLASQISQQQQQQQQGGEVGLHLPSSPQPDPPTPPPQAMYRPPIQRPPVMNRGGGQGVLGVGVGPSPGSSLAPGPYGMPRAFRPGLGLPPQRPSGGEVPMHAFSPHANPHMHAGMPPQRGHEMGQGQVGGGRLPAPPIPMPGQGSPGYPALMAGLFPEEGGGGGGGRGGDRGRGYQALSPLTIQVSALWLFVCVCVCVCVYACMRVFVRVCVCVCVCV